MEPKTPIGTLTQKTACQSIAARIPPTTRPRNCPASAVIWLTPSAIPRCSAGNASVRIAAELPISIAPPKACTTRQPISQSAPGPCRNGSTESASDAAAKTTKPRL